MASTRRMGPKGSDIWNAMLDAAEVILRDLGYGALTSRRVAEHIGVKQRLVYYYFQTMDELIVETFQCLAARDLQRMATALEGKHSLRDIWDVCIRTADTRMVQEFMALANRIEPLRIEVREYIESSRAMHVAAISRAAGGEPGSSALTPVAAAIFASSAALALHREAQIGVTTGHEQVMAIIDGFIAMHDPAQ